MFWSINQVYDTYIPYRQYYLPPYDQVTKDFLKEVVGGTRSFKKIQDVRFIQMPHYDELGVCHQYEKALKLPGMAQFFPRKLPKNRTIDKQFFYNIFNTEFPDRVKALIDHANAQRFTVKNDDLVDNSIQMTDQWAKELEDLPFISKQKGRMSFLLKKKSKVNIERKDRVTYDAYDISKRPRIV